MSYSKTFEQIKPLIGQNTNFVLLSHINTDGDALGSAIALHHYLKDLGKKSSILIPGEIPYKYGFLETETLVNKGSRSEQSTTIANADVIFVLDVSDLSRLNGYYEDTKNSSAQKILIDHHPIDPDWVSHSVIAVEKIATAELVYELLLFLNAHITLKIAKALYTAILSDSGSFRFFKTSAATFKMASELVEIGVEPSEIYSRVFETLRSEQIRSWGNLLANIERDQDNSWLAVSKEFMQSKKLKLFEMDGLVDIMRQDGQANVFAVFVEKDKNEILVGLRSKNGVNVGKIAKCFGGGGHFHAAGFTGTETLDQTVTSTISAIKSFKCPEET